MAEIQNNLIGARSGLIETFHRTAAKYDSLESYRFLSDDESLPTLWTLGAMDRRARAYAARLQAADAQGQRALLVFDPGLEFVAAFVGCLYAGVTAVPAYPPDPMRMHRTLPRLKKIVNDASARFMLSTRSNLGWADTLFGDATGLDTLIAAERVEDQQADNWRQPDLPSDHLALIQYTSGSTGEPKGVMVSHDNLLANLAQIHAKIDFDDALVVSWLPPYHDMGLVGGVLQAWYSARRAVLMSPLAFFQHPYRWLKAIDEYQATTTVAPNFAFDLCVRKITAAERATLDLSRLRLAMNGSEPVRGATIDNFVETFAECGLRRDVFYPCYGMAETTLMVTGGVKQSGPEIRNYDSKLLEQGQATAAADAENTRRLVGAGSVTFDEELCIVDPDSLQVLGDGRVGEIWVAGPNVAKGYWRRAQETAETFAAKTADGRGPFLRTGDLGFLDRGELFVTGRSKDVIILLGRNHYPQDVEETVEACNPALKPNCGAVFSIDVRDQERVVVVQEVMRPKKLDLDALMAQIRREVLAEHGMPLDAIVLIKPGTLTKTSSGKVQRSACREAYVSGQLQVVAQWEAPRNRSERPELPDSFVSPRNEIERILAEAWADVLGIDRVGIHDNFFDLGGHSLVATQLATRLGPQFNLDIPLETLFERPTVADLAAFINQQRHESNPEQLSAMLEQLESMSEQEAQQMINNGSSANGNGNLKTRAKASGNGKQRQRDYLIIGAGPAGLQLGYDLQKAGHDYQILEAADVAGAFFKKFPRHRMLLSINKRYTGFDDPEVNMRWDWNSLLTDPADGAPLFRDFSRDYFPDADALVDYCNAFAKFYDLNIKYGARVQCVSKNDGWEVTDTDGAVYRAKVLIMATGGSKARIPDIEGIELAENYIDMSVDPEDFAGQRVLILGKGNSGFETANHLMGTTSLIHIASPEPIKMAWRTHFVGHVRAINNHFLDTYLLKSQNAALDGDVKKLFRRDGKIVAEIAYAHACGEVEELEYDRVLCCTGFSFDDSMFDETCKPALAINDRFPDQTAEWESTNVPDLYIAGMLMQMRDFKKKQSAFIHGFRYNVHLLSQILDKKYHGRDLPYEKVARDPEAIAQKFIERGDKNSSLWQQTGYFCDVLVDLGEDTFRYYRDLSLCYAQQLWADKALFYAMTFEFGQERIDAAKDVFSVPRVHKDDIERAHESTGIHPIIRGYSGGEVTVEHHVIEDLASEFHGPTHYEPLLAFFERELNSGSNSTIMESAGG